MLHLVRHASAGDRLAWRDDDDLRPLDPKGERQAQALAEELAKAPITRVLSSPSDRCVQTVAPLAAALGLTVEISVPMAEGADGDSALELVERLRAERGDSVLCSHGDVIPAVLRRLARAGLEVDPNLCKKASVWQLHVTDGAITEGTYLPPPTTP